MTKITLKLMGGTTLAVHLWEHTGTNPNSPRRDCLLLHGFPASGATFAAFADVLLLGASDAGLRIVAPDLRGYGDSDKPESGYTCERFAADVQEVAATLSLQNYLLVGHSMGGKIAQVVAAQNPPGLSALVLLTPGMLAPSPPVNVAERIAAHGDADKIRAMVTSWAAHPLDSADADDVTADGLKASPDAWRGWLETMRGEDFSALAAQITVPTLVVGGGKDTVRSEEELQGVVESIAGTTYARLPMSGHLPHLEDPVTLAALLTNFWDGLPASVAS